MNIEKLESEITTRCRDCEQMIFKVMGRDFRDRRWDKKQCPDCKNEFKKNWARAKYRRKVLDQKNA